MDSGREVRGGKRARKKKARDYMGGLASATGYSAVELLRRTGDWIGFREVANVATWHPKKILTMDIVTCGGEDLVQKIRHSRRLKVMPSVELDNGGPSFRRF